MPTYIVYYEVYAQTYVEVEADTPEAAREAADKQIERPSVCYQCAAHLDINDLGEILSVEEVA